MRLASEGVQERAPAADHGVSLKRPPVARHKGLVHSLHRVQIHLLSKASQGDVNLDVCSLLGAYFGNHVLHGARGPVARSLVTELVTKVIVGRLRPPKHRRGALHSEEL